MLFDDPLVLLLKVGGLILGDGPLPLQGRDVVLLLCDAEGSLVDGGLLVLDDLLERLELLVVTAERRPLLLEFAFRFGKSVLP